MATIRPIKIPAGSSHDEPSWKETLRKKAEAWAAGGGAAGYFQRALIAIMSHRGPTSAKNGTPFVPKVVGDAKSLGSFQEENTGLGNKRIGAGVWIEQRCATGQVLYVFLPDLKKQSATSMFRRGNWLVQTDSSYRYLYAPKTVVAILGAGYPRSA